MIIQEEILVPAEEVEAFISRHVQAGATLRRIESHVETETELANQRMWDEVLPLVSVECEFDVFGKDDICVSIGSDGQWCDDRFLRFSLDEMVKSYLGEEPYVYGGDIWHGSEEAEGLAESRIRNLINKLRSTADRLEGSLITE
jgi:hypothetical protein